MKEVTLSKNSWVYKFLDKPYNIFGIDINDSVFWYNIKSTCDLRNALLNRFICIILFSLFSILAATILLSGILQFILFLYFGNTMFTFLPTVSYVFLSVGFVTDCVILFFFTTLTIRSCLIPYIKDKIKYKYYLYNKNKETKEPNIFVTLWKSLKDKVCHKIKIVD